MIVKAAQVAHRDRIQAPRLEIADRTNRVRIAGFHASLLSSKTKFEFVPHPNINFIARIAQLWQTEVVFLKAS